MTTIHKNFKTISGGTLENVLYEYNLDKNQISHDSISLNFRFMFAINLSSSFIPSDFLFLTPPPRHQHYPPRERIWGGTIDP
jgi:hypothetical protein